MTSTVYPVGGSFEDWAYAAGWDTVANAGFETCYPTKGPTTPADFYTRYSTEQVRAAVYLIETDNHKDPPLSAYGGRQIIRDDQDSAKFQVLDGSIYDTTPNG